MYLMDMRITYFLCIFRNPPMKTDEKTLTVVFHAILSDNFPMGKDSKLVIRGDEPIFDGWNKHGIHVQFVQ